MGLKDMLDDLEDKFQNGFWNFFEKVDDFCGKLEDFGGSLGNTKTNNYGDLPMTAESKNKEQ